MREERNVSRQSALEEQVTAELEAADLNRATVDNFLIEHPDISEKAVNRALRKISNINIKNSKNTH